MIPLHELQLHRSPLLHINIQYRVPTLRILFSGKYKIITKLGSTIFLEKYFIKRNICDCTIIIWPDWNISRNMRRNPRHFELTRNKDVFFTHTACKGVFNKLTVVFSDLKYVIMFQYCRDRKLGSVKAVTALIA